MMPRNHRKLIRIVWGFFILSHNQVYGDECPVNHVCAKGTHFYVWTGKLATKNEATKYCNDRGLIVLRGFNAQSLQNELMRPNLTKVIQENTTIWLGAVFSYYYDAYVWEDTDEKSTFVFVGRRNGDCLTIINNGTEVAPGNCLALHHIVCMAYKYDWFGQDQRYRCRCKSKECSSSGQCPSGGDKCALGWFGESCQLRDYLLDLKHELLDFNRFSCIGRRHEAVFQIEPAMYFSWIRIVAHSAVNYSTFDVVLATGLGTFTCPRENSFIVSDKTIDVSCCTHLVPVTKVSVKYTGIVMLCSVHIYRGQNVALKEKSTIISESRVLNAPFIVDGERSIVSPSSSSIPQMSLNEWQLEFSVERIVFEVIAYFKYPVSEDVSVQLEFKNTLDEAIARLNVGNSAIKQGASMLRFLSGTTDKIKYVTLTFPRTTVSVDHGLDLSEVEIYGACKVPYYSLQCDKKCGTEMEANKCYFDNTCGNQTTTTKASVRTTPTTTSTSLMTVTTPTSRSTTKKPPQPFQCPLGFFGKKCQFLCNCKKNLCHKDGACKEGSFCKDGWFALSCQYNDLAVTSKSSNPLVTDNDDDTCYIPAENVISANLTEAILYTWVRVVFKRYDSEVCEHIRVVTEKSNQYDIFCSNEIVATYIELTWQGNGSVCSLFINGGRNVAIESYISSFTDDMTFQTNPLKDGITTGTACLHFPSDENKKITLRYREPQTVTRIVVYTAGIQEKNSFIIQVSFGDDITVNRYKALQGARHVVFLSKSKISKVLNVTFQVIEGSINVCEIEIYGDCAPPYYYFGCTETCILTCYKHRCNYNGFCYNCRHGLHGTHCMEASNGDENIQIEEENVPKKLPKKKESFNVFIYLSIPIMGLACFTYNVLDLFQREQRTDHDKERMSKQSQGTNRTFSYCSTQVEESEGDEMVERSEITSHSV